jgi:hypothetical protein
MLCCVMLCYVVLCYVMLCCVMLCYVVLCYVVLCCVVLPAHLRVGVWTFCNLIPFILYKTSQLLAVYITYIRTCIIYLLIYLFHDDRCAPGLAVHLLAGDGGYKQTSRMVCEAGICIARMMDAANDEEDEEEEEGGEEGRGMFGVLTPSTALGEPFLDRLNDSPGITFPLEG